MLNIAAARARWCLVALALAMALLSTAGAEVQGKEATEYEIKAAFLLQFADYVQWPGTAPAESAPFLRICLLGPDPFEGALDTLVASHRASGRAVSLQRVGSAEVARQCHIVFISQTQREARRRALAQLRDHPVLTVGEGELFVADGGVLAFRVEQGRVRLIASTAAAQRADLRISSRLLGVAQVVD